MLVHVVADDPIREAVVAALSDVDVEVRDATPDAIDDARFAIVSASAGAETFREANEAALAGNTPWVAVEIGGVGGHPLATVDAAVSGFASGVGCYDCLRSRVEATVDELTDGARADRSAARLAGALAGRECVRIFSGEEPSILGHVVELPYVRRRFLPVPGCACDSDGRDRRLERTDETKSLQEAVERVEPAIDDRVGIVESIGEADSFPAPYYLATVADTTGFSDASAPTNAAGVDVDWNAALMKAVGEGLERYCGAVYRDDDFVFASETELEHVVSPTDLVRPDETPTYEPSGTHRWVLGECLATGEPTHLPAAAVQFPQPGERLVPSITTGLGLGSSTVDALLSGLTEVLERDATMLAWYSTFEPMGLSVDGEAYDALERRARSEGLGVTPLLVTQDVDLPVVAVAVHRDPDDHDGWPHFAVGSGAALDGTAAARAALAEALQNWMELRGLGADDAADASAAIGEYGSFPDPAQEFVDVDGTIPVENVGTVPTPTGREALDELVSRTVDVGLRPYAARLTTRDVEELGFEAVRVVVPGAQPLFTGDPFFGERARTVPLDLGFEPRLDRPYHPYP